MCRSVFFGGKAVFKRILTAVVLTVLVVPASGRILAGEGKVAARPAGVPASAEAWVVMPAPAKTVERIKVLAEKVYPGSGAMFQMVVGQTLAQQGGDALDLNKPVVVILVPSEQPKFAARAGVKAGSDPLKAMEARFGKSAGSVNGLVKYLQVQPGALPDKEIFVRIKDGYLTFGDSKQLVEKLSAAAPPGENAYQDSVDIVAGVDPAAIFKQHKSVIDGFITALESGAPLIAEVDGARVDDEDGRKLKAACIAAGSLYATTLRSLMKEMSFFQVQLSTTGKSASFSYSVGFGSDGKIAEAMKALEAVSLPTAVVGGKRVLYANAGNIPPQVAGPLAELVNELVFKSLALVNTDIRRDLGPDFDIDKFTKLMKNSLKAWKHFSGDFQQLVKVADGGGLGIVAMAGLKDRTAAREAIFEILQGVKELAAAPNSKFPLKVTSLKKDARKSGTAPVDRLAMDISLAGNADLPAEVRQQMEAQTRKMIEGLYGLPMIYELAWTEKQVIYGFGRDASKLLDTLVAAKGQAAAVEKGSLASLIKNAPKGSFAVGQISVLEYAKFVVNMLKNTPMGPMMPQVDLGAGPDQNPICVTVSSQGGRGTVNVLVPVQPIAKVVKAVMQAQAAMMNGAGAGRPGGPMPVQPGRPGPEEF
jgi:hypothetical protein